MKQLLKFGKRKCYTCQNIFLLNSENFYRSRSSTAGFTYQCKKCKKPNKNSYRLEMIRKFNFTCNHCKLYKRDDYQFFDIDHIKPIRRRTNGWSKSNRLRKKDGQDNLQLLCPNCHRIKSIKEGRVFDIK